MAASELIDIRNVSIDSGLPIRDRVKSMVRQIKDPYHFRHKDVTVHINFIGQDSLEDRIIELYKNT
jgi:hypothetical protein